MVMEGQDDLTAREREVLELLLQRWTNEEIARELHIKVRTVESHISHILHKTGFKKRQGLWGALIG